MRALCLAVAAGLLAAPASAQLSDPAVGYTPPAVGTMLRYESTFGDEPGFEVTQVVVATGADFAMFATLPDNDFDTLMNVAGELTADDYFVEFSGLYWQICSSDMPSREEREALRALWPVEKGASVKIDSDEHGVFDVDVLETGAYDFAGIATVDTFTVRTGYEEPEFSLFAPDLGVAVRIDWGGLSGSSGHSGSDLLLNKSQLSENVALAFKGDVMDECMPDPL